MWPIIKHLAATITAGRVESTTHAVGELTAEFRCGTGIAEGWRGTIAQRVEIGLSGRLSLVKIVDPSVLNWPALPVALTDTIGPDFPLTNKSCNLSYAGNDL